MKKLSVFLLFLIVLCSSILVYNFANRKIDSGVSSNLEISVHPQNSQKSNGYFITTYNEIMEYINKSGARMIVIGKTGCNYCDAYKPVLQNASSEYNFEYLYIDVSKLSNEDFNLFFHSNIIIPGKCRNDGVDGSLLDGIGTPLTLFMKNKTSYNCIRGYVNKETLVETLKTISFIN